MANKPIIVLTKIVYSYEYIIIGEDIGTAAVREVREETGVESEFVSILCFRHQHGYRHGLSDFYFICLLRPTSETIKKCDQEIHDARWMDVSWYFIQDCFIQRVTQECTVTLKSVWHNMYVLGDSFIEHPYPRALRQIVRAKCVWHEFP